MVQWIFIICWGPLGHLKQKHLNSGSNFLGIQLATEPQGDQALSWFHSIHNMDMVSWILSLNQD
jgi:hypothetical protein